MRPIPPVVPSAKIIPLFPAGSTRPPTEAASAIWRSFDDFASKARTLEREAERLATTKGADAHSMAQQVKRVPRRVQADTRSIASSNERIGDFLSAVHSHKLLRLPALRPFPSNSWEPQPMSWAVPTPLRRLTTPSAVACWAVHRQANIRQMP